MSKKLLSLASLIAPAILGSVVTSGCDKIADAADAAGQGFEKLCGPCGLVSQGDIGISGNAKVDGFFSAVASLNQSFVDINGKFEAHIDNLIAAFGVSVKADATLDAKIKALKAEIDGQVKANASAGLSVNYVPARCQANVSVAVDAQAKCEAKAGCTGEVSPGEVAVKCEGSCEGSCSGECSGGFQCDLSAGGECKGECSGSCEIKGDAECNGSCHGDCGGTCEVKDSNGKCAGKCDGMCTGTCELAASASCKGTCTGSCKVEAMADCTGKAPSCSGSCSGECSGSCTGKATPPSAHVDCDASADCKAQASAQASANLSCTPPALDIGFTFTGDASAQGAFTAKMGALKVEGIAIVQGFGSLTALFTGKIDGKTVISPAPLAQVTSSVQGLVSGSGSVFADIPAGRITCAIAGFTEAGTILSTLGTNAQASITAQTGFVGSLTSGDFGS